MTIPRCSVSVHPNYFRGLDPSTDEYKKLLIIAKEFKNYWCEGYHPDFGRDKPFERPEGIEEAGLCKVHVRLTQLSDKHQIEWDQKSLSTLAPIDRSHTRGCDSFLIYSVSKEGTALILSLYDEDAHKQIRSAYYPILRGMGNHAKSFFDSRGQTVASQSEILKLLSTPTSSSD